MIAVVGRALLWLLCAMTAPRPPIPDLPPIQPKPKPTVASDQCVVCGIQPHRAGSDYCGDACQAIWITGANRAISLDPTPTLPDGTTLRRTR